MKLGNDTRLQVKGKGNIKLKIDGVSQIIFDVYYIPELKNNLLSIGHRTITRKGISCLVKG